VAGGIGPGAVRTLTWKEAVRKGGRSIAQHIAGSGHTPVGTVTRIGADVLPSVLAAGSATTVDQMEEREAEAEVVEHVIDHIRHPEAAKHAEDYYEQHGKWPEGWVDREGTKKRRRSRIKKGDRVKGKDIDEQPPAVLVPDGPVSTRPISSKDNRGDGARLGHAIKGKPNGTKVRIKVNRNP
ncbi:MAG: hypothetical protein AAF570_14185, partial [Bacteroidota bacterium]